MASPKQVQKDYDSNAKTYSNYTAGSYGILEDQLIGSALGDCTGATVLDLGGGTGLRAQQALDAGAASVDLVDISPEMVRVGGEMAASRGRSDAIRWFVADVSRPLDALPLREEGYDLVMANWIFDHAGSVEELEGMWRNIAAYLKPGGRFLGVRSCDPRVPAFANGQAKYGVTYKDFAEIPGGLRYRYTLHLDPPVEFECTSMEVSYSGSTAMHEKYGLCDVEIEPYESAEAVRSDPDFWALFTDAHPNAVVKARKKAN